MKTDYRVGEKVELTIYDIDSLNVRYKRIVQGKVIQKTDKLITINNGVYNETYQLNQLIENNEIQPSEPYELDEENYAEDIVKDCINALKNGKSGYLFSKNQLEQLYEKLPESLDIEKRCGIFKINLKK